MKNINWDNVQEATESQRLAPGGYVCGIVMAEDVPQKEYLSIQFDIAEGDQKNYFRQLRDRLELDDWPFDGTFIRSYKPKAQPFFKAFLTSVEVSNPGYKFNNDERTLSRKYVGLVLGEEEYVSNDGTVKTRLRVAQVRSIKAIRDGDFKVPELKKVAPGTTVGYAAASTSANNDFAPIDDNEDLPF